MAEIVKRFLTSPPSGTVAYRYEPFIDGETVGFRVTDPSGATTIVGLTPPSTWEEYEKQKTDKPLGPTGAVWVVRDGIHLTAVETVSTACEDPEVA